MTTNRKIKVVSRASRLSRIQVQKIKIKVYESINGIIYEE